MERITFKVVFDRKHLANNRTKKGLVQVEAYCNRKRMYISTGIKVFKNQWDLVRQRTKSTLQSNEYNKIIDSILKICEGYKAHCIGSNVAFSFDGLKSALSNHGSDNFIEFCLERVEKKNLRSSTKRQHRSSIQILSTYGRIRTFNDITYENIVRYDEWLHIHYSIQSTIYTKHKVLRSYINEAVRFEKLSTNPYDRFPVDKGKPSEGKFVLKEDIDKVISAKLPRSLINVRDLIIVQFYTGLAYCDLMTFHYNNIKEVNGTKVLMGDRTKTGVKYTIPLLQQVIDVLTKYPNGLPKITNVQYNLRMKEVFRLAGVKKADEISSHWLRRGCGYWLLNSGVSMETVSRVLAHSGIRITESIYAKLLPTTIVDEILNHVK